MTATTKPSRPSPRALLRHLHPTNLKVAAQLATQATQGVANLVQGVYRSLHRQLRLSMSAEPEKTRGLPGQIDRGIGGVAMLVGKGSDAVLAMLNGVVGDRLVAA
jgi:hypothetical protein